MAIRVMNTFMKAARFTGIVRPYTAKDVVKQQGNVKIEHTLARQGSEKLWRTLQTEPFIRALGAVTGNQAIQMAQVGLKSIYCSGWQIAGDNNSSGETYPDQSLYPVDSMPRLVRTINNSLQRADQIHGNSNIDWFLPLMADAEAGFGGNLNTYELIKHLIEAGAAGVHLEDQLASAKKCGHMGGKVVVPTNEFIKKLIAARLAADVMNVPTVIIARTDTLSAKIISSDADPIDHPFIDRTKRTKEGFYRFNGNLQAAIARGHSYAPYADLLWFETNKPDLNQAEEFAFNIHLKYPGKLLAYNCSPSFNWRKYLSMEEIAEFQERLGKFGYKYQFVTLAGFHALNLSMFELARAYKDQGMTAYSELQQREFAWQKDGYSAIKHQEFVGTNYFDRINEIINDGGGESEISAMKDSTEKEQFN